MYFSSFVPKFTPTQKIWCVSFLVATFFCSVQSLQAASFAVTPAEEQYQVGDTFAVNIYVDPQGEPLSSVRGTLQYDSKVLQPESILRTGTQFTDWSIIPTIETENSSIIFSGTNKAGIRTPQTVFIVRFKAIEEGSGSIAFDNPYIKGLDSSRGNILTETKGAKVEVVNSSNLRDSEYPIPTIYSSSFPTAGAWYRSTAGEFSWSLSDEVTATAVSITPEKNLTPQRSAESVYTPPIDRLVLNSASVSLGEQYLSVRHQYDDEWGPVATRLIRIDTIPPEPFSVEVISKSETSSSTVLRFNSRDTISGVASYAVHVGSESYTVSPVEAYFGYTLPDSVVSSGGSLRVVAYDKAGNAREADKTLVLLPADIEKAGTNDTITYSGLLLGSVIVAGLAFCTIIILLILYLRHEATLYKRRTRQLQKETREIKVQTKKIFRALRDEIKEQIQLLSNKKKLNKNESQAVEGLGKALEVSETLLNKEIDDVETVLKK